MTNLENKIPIKGYATFDPLKHCWIGSGFKSEWFNDLQIAKNKAIIDPLKRIADETEEDYQTLEKILKQAGVQTYRSFLDINKVGSLKNIFRPPVNPRDHFAVIGEKIYACSGGNPGFFDVLKKIDRKNMVVRQMPGTVATSTICRLGKDLWWDLDIKEDLREEDIEIFKNRWTEEGFRVHLSKRGYHSDGVFCVAKQRAIQGQTQYRAGHVSGETKHGNEREHNRANDSVRSSHKMTLELLPETRVIKRLHTQDFHE